jgi:hypothetical protein
MRIASAIVVVLCLAASACDAESSSEPGSIARPSESSSTEGLTRLSFVVQPDMSPVQATVEVADGFAPGDAWYVVSGDGDAFLGLWTADEVARDACIGPDDEVVTPGPTARDLVDALAAQGSMRSTQPEEVSLAGYDGFYLELTGPPDMGACDKGKGLTHERGIYSDSQVDLLWILDVEGQRLVVDASHGPTASDSEIEALDAMVGSLAFS